MKYLTTSQKDKLLGFLLKRDGSNCFYCKIPFDQQSHKLKRTFDHLNNNNKENGTWNLVLCHWKCNQEKKRSAEYQIMADEKLHENQVSFDSLSVCVSQKLESEPKQASKEIDLNVAMKKLAWEFINERLITQGKPALNFNDTAHSIAFIFWQRTGHGSSETVKRHLLDFCSESAPFKRVEESGEDLIQKR